MEAFDQIRSEAILPEYSKIFRTYLEPETAFIKKGEFMNRIKKKKLQQSMTRFGAREEVEKSMKEYNSKYDFASSEKEKYERILFSSSEKTQKELLQKLAIISKLISPEIHNGIIRESNHIEYSVFSSVLGPQKLAKSALKQKYIEAMAPFNKEISKLQNFLIGRLRFLPSEGRTDMKACNHHYKEVKEEVEDIEKLEEERPMKFIVSLVNEVVRSEYGLEKVYNQMEENMKEYESKGIYMDSIRNQIKSYDSGFYSKENVTTFMNMFCHANFQTNMFRLPKRFQRGIPYVADRVIEDIESEKKFFDKVFPEKKFEIQELKASTRETLEEITKSRPESQIKNDHEKYLSLVISGKDADSELDFDINEFLNNKSEAELKELGIELIGPGSMYESGGEVKFDMDSETKTQVFSFLTESERKAFNSMDEEMKKSGKEVVSREYEEEGNSDDDDGFREIEGEEFRAK